MNCGKVWHQFSFAFTFNWTNWVHKETETLTVTDENVLVHKMRLWSIMGRFTEAETYEIHFVQWRLNAVTLMILWQVNALLHHYHIKLCQKLACLYSVSKFSKGQLKHESLQFLLFNILNCLPSAFSLANTNGHNGVMTANISSTSFFIHKLSFSSYCMKTF